MQECELQASEDPAIYTEAQCQRLLNSIHAGNNAHGGLALVLEVGNCLRANTRPQQLDGQHTAP
jgi:hypothetical protein